MTFSNVCVFCGSSENCDQIYLDAAYELGSVLATSNTHIFFGGGKIGLMGTLALGALDNGGKITGIIPRFMYDNGWGHSGITEMCIVDSMHDRKQKMLACADAFIALPGGCGTFEELLESITWKQLNLHTNPIIIVNIRSYFQPLLKQLELSISEKFLEHRHQTLWYVVDSVHDIINRLTTES